MDKNGFHLFADADPVKLTSGIDQLATQLSSTFGKVNAVLLTLGDTYGLAYFFHTVQALISALDFLQSLVPLLEETSITCFTSPFPPPRSAEVTLGKCVELFNSIVLSLCELGMSPEVCEKSNQTSPKGQTALRLRMILKAPRVAPALCDRMSRFEKATTLLHSIVMNSVTHRMLEEQNVALMQLVLSADRYQGVSGTEQHTEHNDVPEPYRPARPMRYSYADRTLFDAVVTRIHGEGVAYYPAIGKKDSGSTANFATQAFIRRAALGDQVEVLAEEQTFRCLNNYEIVTDKQIRIQWHLPNDLESRTTTFLVVDEGPCELLFGKTFTEEHFAPVETALILQRWESKEKEEQRNKAHAHGARRADDALLARIGRPRLPQPPPLRTTVHGTNVTANNSEHRAEQPETHTFAPVTPQVSADLDQRLTYDRDMDDHTEAEQSGLTNLGRGRRETLEVPDANGPAPAAELETPNVTHANVTTTAIGISELLAPRFDGSVTPSAVGTSLARRSTPDDDHVPHGTSTDITPASSSDIQRPHPVPLSTGTLAVPETPSAVQHPSPVAEGTTTRKGRGLTAFFRNLSNKNWGQR